MKKIVITTLTGLLLLSASCAFSANINKNASATAQEQEKNVPKWIFKIKTDQAKIEKVESAKFRLVISNLKNTQLFMLNDRPFYLIRKIDQTGEELWSGLSHSNYAPNKTVTATIITEKKGLEVKLSDFKLENGIASYTVETATDKPITQTPTGHFDIFMSADAKPLCSFMNDLRHEAQSLDNLKNA